MKSASRSVSAGKTAIDPLTELAHRYGTDKLAHGFCPFYHSHLASLRDSAKKVLEIGVLRGQSLLMWRDYFPNAQIHGLDISPPDLPPLDRIHLHTGDQSDRSDLQALIDRVGSGFDLVVDDGGHTMTQQQTSFDFLFPHLAPSGVYIIEDLHTSFMEQVVTLRGGQVVDSYPTGVGEGQTTYEMVTGLEGAVLFDRDGDRKHITSVIRS